jgi:IclR family transcriptional regulator, KDG regulon repressor
MYQAPIVQKAFRILDLVSRRDNCLTLSDISRELGISKSTVHGIAHALETAGVLVRDDETKCFSLGLALLNLAQKVYSRIDLKDIARPVMEELMGKTQQSVFLGIRSNNHVSIVDIVEPSRNLKITAPIGARIPLMAGAVGKIFLSALSDAEAARLIGTIKLRKDTEKSIIDPVRYMEDIREARKTGYALDDEEYLKGVRAVAALIPAAGQPKSAIWVVGFTQNLPGEKLTGVALETRRAAESIARNVSRQT